MTKLNCVAMMKEQCAETVTHIDNKGFIYCSGCGYLRKATRVPCRKMTKGEIKTLENNGVISYSRTRK